MEKNCPRITRTGTNRKKLPFVNIRVDWWVKIGLLVGCCFSIVRAELVWQQKSIQLNVHPLQVEAETAFHCANTGTKPVDILSVQTSCGCLKAAAVTNRIMPGTSGSVSVTFDFHDKTGPQRKSVAVRSSDNPSKPSLLYVEANIPDIYSLEPARLEWSLTSDHGSKTCRLVNRSNSPIRLVSVLSSSDQFTAELKPIRDGFEYNVQVCPVESSIPGLAAITIQTECPAELSESRAYILTAVIR